MKGEAGKVGGITLCRAGRAITMLVPALELTGQRSAPRGVGEELQTRTAEGETSQE